MKDPKWADCIDTVEFVSYFGIKSGYGPVVKEKWSWNRCWSHVPRLWAAPVKRLIERIEESYDLERASDPDGEYDVVIDQVKDKFGTLRVYFTAENEGIRYEVDQMIEQCIEEITSIDPNYGRPW
jgi:hypothetical protein